MMAIARRARRLSAVVLAVCLSAPVSAAPDALSVAPARAPDPASNHAPGGAVALPSLPALPHAGEQVKAHAQSGMALDGFDPVAYFDTGRPIAGLSRHEVAVNGAVWRFASAANRAAFLANPDAYWPGFGGYDPIGVAQGNAVEASAEHFLIFAARLYLFRSKTNREAFSRDPGALAAALARWPDVEKRLAH